MGVHRYQSSIWLTFIPPVVNLILKNVNIIVYVVLLLATEILSRKWKLNVTQTTKRISLGPNLYHSLEKSTFNSMFKKACMKCVRN